MRRIVDAIVLRVVDYGDADRVVTLMTRQLGKVSALARGARRSRKRFGGALGLFGTGQGVLLERRGELWGLESFDAKRGFPHLGLEVAKVAHGAYACELVRELASEAATDERLFELLAELLGLLDAGDPRAERLRAFELQLLDLLGFGAVLDRCLACNRPQVDRFDAQRGGGLCTKCSDAPTLTPSARTALLALARLPLAAAPPLGEVAGEVRDLVQALLSQHLRRPLASLDFIAKINRYDARS